MNAMISLFVIYVEVIIYLLLHNLHDCPFNRRDTFAIGCFHGWETKFAKINFTSKDFHPLCTDKFLQKKFFKLFHENKFRRKRLSGLFREKKITKKKDSHENQYQDLRKKFQ